MVNNIVVLHVVYAMNLGGIENWLMHLYRSLKQDNVQFHFLVNLQNEGVFDNEIILLGGKIIYGQHFNNPFKQYLHLKNIFKNKKKYSAIHIHNLESSIVVHLALNNKSKSPIIFQSHNDFKKRVKNQNLIRKVWLYFSKFYVNLFFTNKIAVSKSAGHSLFWIKNYKIIPIGEDFSSFSGNPSLLNKEDFGFKNSDIVISHVGRFFPQKNHLFLLNLFVELKKCNLYSFKCLLIGEGPTQDECIEFIKKYSLNDDVLLLNRRMDIPLILLSVSDLFIFPSIYEGLGLVVVEAQAAGLPVICSDAIPDEAIIIPELVQKIELQKDLNFWVAQIISHFKNNSNYSKVVALQKVMKSSLNIEVGKKQLILLWKNQ